MMDCKVSGNVTNGGKGWQGGRLFHRVRRGAAYKGRVGNSKAGRHAIRRARTVASVARSLHAVWASRQAH